MTVRAVTAQVPATRSLQFWRTPDFVWEQARDDALVGDPYDPEWPDRPLNFQMSGRLHAPAPTPRVHVECDPGQTTVPSGGEPSPPEPSLGAVAPSDVSARPADTPAAP